MNQLISFQEFRQRISIMELAMANGYTFDKKKGLKWPVLKNVALNDTIIVINPANSANQGYFNPQNDNDKGTLYNFILNRLGTVFSKLHDTSEKNINTVLYGWLKMDHPVNQGIIPIVNKYEFNSALLQPLTNIEYLKSRGFNGKTLLAKEFKNRIFNHLCGRFINTCFPYYNAEGEIVACENRNIEYKMQSLGSDRSIGIWHSNIPLITKQVILTESPIDALSYHQLKGKENLLYISFGGSIAPGQIGTLKVVLEQSKKDADFSIVSGFDNDRQGDKYFNNIKEIFPALTKDLPVGKDYNEDLINSLKMAKRMHL